MNSNIFVADTNCMTTVQYCCLSCTASSKAVQVKSSVVKKVRPVESGRVNDVCDVDPLNLFIAIG